MPTACRGTRHATIPSANAPGPRAACRAFWCPTMPLVLVWAAGAFIARRAGISPDLIAAASQAALVPIWFLAVYIIITVAVPVSVKVWDALGLWSVLILAAAAIAVDALGFGAGLGWLRWVELRLRLAGSPSAWLLVAHVRPHQRAGLALICAWRRLAWPSDRTAGVSGQHGQRTRRRRLEHAPPDHRHAGHRRHPDRHHPASGSPRVALAWRIPAPGRA